MAVGAQSNGGAPVTLLLPLSCSPALPTRTQAKGPTITPYLPFPEKKLVAPTTQLPPSDLTSQRPSLTELLTLPTRLLSCVRGPTPHPLVLFTFAGCWTALLSFSTVISLHAAPEEVWSSVLRLCLDILGLIFFSPKENWKGSLWTWAGLCTYPGRRSSLRG